MFPLLVRELQEAIGRASQLEGMARLQALAFQPDGLAANVAFNEGRLLDHAIDPHPRFDHILAPDKLRFR